ncbi:hypothetical protein ZIOFF_063646 [Zingiber officinale]|uniref:DUF676 domain-containing protein n=1 Tax=Zingiber officinale TaxID=94328 RepID=A0A8J5F2G1_ZINOF|nr:hypothetical protein ZIOFF_063646 [Zingiber officinale]
MKFRPPPQLSAAGSTASVSLSSFPSPPVTLKMMAPPFLTPHHGNEEEDEAGTVFHSQLDSYSVSCSSNPNLSIAYANVSASFEWSIVDAMVVETILTSRDKGVIIDEEGIGALLMALGGGKSQEELTMIFATFRWFQNAINFICAGMNTVWGDLNFRLHSVQGSSMASGTDYDFKQAPDHLLVLVHGIMASPSDWTYAKAELERQLGSNFLIYASSCNGFTKTFDGIDRAGKRLAEEISSVVQKTGSLQRISILAHSLGGLFSRYAIAVLYSTDSLHKDQVDDYRNTNTQMENSLKLGSIAGLQPINFITLATPHLGVRGKKQLPFLLGLPLLEKLAPPIAPILVGRTGQQLFLTDEKPNRPPLLLRMASKSDDLEFISSLNSFRNRILYANVSYDRILSC